MRRLPRLRPGPPATRPSAEAFRVFQESRGKGWYWPPRQAVCRITVDPDQPDSLGFEASRTTDTAMTVFALALGLNPAVLLPVLLFYHPHPLAPPPSSSFFSSPFHGLLSIFKLLDFVSPPWYSTRSRRRSESDARRQLVSAPSCPVAGRRTVGPAPVEPPSPPSTFNSRPDRDVPTVVA